MSDQYEPVRAWAEYDEWSVYWQYIARLESAWFIPKAGEGLAYNLSDIPLATMIEGQALHGYALRSLRVLLRSGHEVGLVRSLYTSHGGSREVRYAADLGTGGRGSSYWDAYIRECEGAEWRWKSSEVTDTEAVSRALSEARRWLEENEQEAIE